MGLKDFFIKKMLEKQLKNVPAAQRDMIMKLVEEHPELFAKISKEVQALTKGGQSQMTAMMQVMKKYQGELQSALGGNMPQKRGGQRPF